MDEMTKARAAAYAERCREEQLELLRTLGRMPAPSRQEDLRAAFCRDWLLRQGAQDVTVDGAKNVVCRLGPADCEDLVVFAAHTDIVFPDLDTLPRQLYVTVAAPNEEVYRTTCRPKQPGCWDRLMETLDLLPSLDTRTVIRHTLVKGLNFGYVDQYAELDRRADPDLVEPKGYVFVGSSRMRLTIDSMPRFNEIMEFSEDLGQRIGMTVLKKKEDSKVVLLGHEGVETDVMKLYGLE